MSKFNGVELTQETILECRQWFADNCQACINDAISGEQKVNDITSYIVWQTESKQNALIGKWDYTFAFLQRAHFMQTGECVALLK